jgi:hypothetical protein
VHAAGGVAKHLKRRSFGTHHYGVQVPHFHMKNSSTRSLFVTLCFLSGLVVVALSTMRNMPPNTANKRRRVPTQLESSADNADDFTRGGKLEELKQKEIELSKLLAEVRREKISELRAKPLRIGTCKITCWLDFIATLA